MRNRKSFSQLIAQFFYEGRLALFVLTLIVALFMMTIAPSLHINSDMSKYLSKSSNMKQGMDIQEGAFKAEETRASLRLMFEGLENDDEVYSRLKKFDFIKEIEHEENPDFVNGNKKLFILKSEAAYDSKEFKGLEKELPQLFSDMSFKFQSDEIQKSEVETSILVFAFLATMLILVLMCASWLEPFIILFVGGIAVMINVGSNWLLPYVSDISHSIGPILQLVLSIDYSVMLLNRYRKEKLLKSENPLQSAISKAFAPIIASSVTTVVGLLALMFMGFKIGGEVGFVLAKGVFLSLVCVFFLLPQLIKWLDKWIEKSSKKAVVLKTGGLVSFSYALRRIMPFIFIALICAGYFLKDNTKIIFTEGIRDEIAESFERKNQSVLIYDNADEGKIPELIEELKKDKGVKKLTAYSNTLNKPLSIDELLTEAEAFSKDLTREALQIIYSRHENRELKNIEISSLLKFLMDEAPRLSENGLLKGAGLDERLRPFIDRAELNEERELSKLASILGLSAEEGDLLARALAVKTGFAPSAKLSLGEIEGLISALDEEKIKKFNIDGFSSEKLLELKQKLHRLTSGELAKKLPTAEIYKANNIDEEKGALLSAAALTQNPDYAPPKQPILNAIQLILKLEPSNEGLNRLNGLIELSMKGTPLSKEELAGFFGIDEKMLEGLLQKAYGEAEKKLTIDELLKLLSDEQALQMLSEEQRAGLTELTKILELVKSGAELSHTEASKLLGIDEGRVKMLYALLDKEALSALKLSQLELSRLLLGLDEKALLSLSEEEKAQIETLLFVSKAIEENRRFSYEEFAKSFKTDNEKARLLFILGEDGESLISQRASLLSLLRLINELEPKAETKELLALAELVNEGRELSFTEAFEKLNSLARLSADTKNELSEGRTRLLYEYYFAKNSNESGHKIALIELIPFINKQIEEDAELKKLLSEEQINKLKEAESDILKAKEKLVSEKYSRLIIESNYKEESKETSEFMARLNALKDNLPNKAYLIGSSQLVFELENSFKKEFSVVSLICVASIFLVVLLSFKSLIIPMILVLLVQLGVYITICIVGIQGYKIYYLALLIVQSILMGATIDYAIVLSSYYRELRQSLDLKEAMKKALSETLHTIACSGLILIIVAAILGIFVKTLTIAQICSTIALGALATVLLIIFVLPSLIMGLDRFIVFKKQRFVPEGAKANKDEAKTEKKDKEEENSEKA